MHQIVCWLGLCLDPTGGACRAPPDTLGVFRGPISKGRRGERKGREERGEGEERGGREFVLCPRKKKEKSAPMANSITNSQSK